MKIIDLEQGTPEWHAFRTQHIGGSDAPAVMGVSPYKTRYELWMEKTGATEVEEPTVYMKRGSDLEKHVREEMEEMLMCELTSCVFEHEDIGYLSYSSDGYSARGSILIEIKCGTKEGHEGVRRGAVPNKYYPQLQHALLVTGLSEIYYVSHNGGETIYTIVERCDDYVEQLRYAHKAFWRCVVMLEEPKVDEVHRKSTKKELVKKNTEAFETLVRGWRSVQEHKREVEEMEKRLREDILAYCDGEECEGFGMKVHKVQRSGHIDYSVIEELKAVDLEKYRKKATESWRIDYKELF